MKSFRTLRKIIPTELSEESSSGSASDSADSLEIKKFNDFKDKMKLEANEGKVKLVKPLLKPPPLTRKNTMYIPDLGRRTTMLLPDVPHDPDLDDIDEIIIPKRKWINIEDELTWKEFDAAMKNIPLEDEIKEVKGQGVKRKRYCFTYNNPKCEGEEFKKHLEDSALVTLGVFQKEVGDSGTEHFQGYIELKDRMYTTGVQKIMNPHKVALLHAKGTKKQNENYCTKLEGCIDGPWYINNNKAGFSTKNGAQGKRTDQDEFALMVEEQGGITENVREAFPGHALRFNNHAKQLISDIKYKAAKDAKKDNIRERIEARKAGIEISKKPRKLILYFGPSAVGKSERAEEWAVEKYDELAYEKPGGNKWWCGYDNEKVVLVDEWRREFTGDMETFNNITNQGLSIVENKGGMATITAEAMLFTTNRHPMDIFKTNWDDARFKAVARRFEEVHWWNDEKELVILTNPGKPEDTDAWRAMAHHWCRFWQWKDRSISEGDEITPEEASKYFTL